MAGRSPLGFLRIILFYLVFQCSGKPVFCLFPVFPAVKLDEFAGHVVIVVVQGGQSFADKALTKWDPAYFGNAML